MLWLKNPIRRIRPTSLYTNFPFPDISVIRPAMVEITSLGAAFAAGKAVGVWSPSKVNTDGVNTDEVNKAETGLKVFESKMEAEVRERKFAEWKKAVVKSLGKEPYALND